MLRPNKVVKRKNEYGSEEIYYNENEGGGRWMTRFAL